MAGKSSSNVWGRDPATLPAANRLEKTRRGDGHDQWTGLTMERHGDVTADHRCQHRDDDRDVNIPLKFLDRRFAVAAGMIISAPISRTPR